MTDHPTEDEDELSDIHSFIIRIWLEEETGAYRTDWHGHITHVHSGKRQFIKRLSEITEFIQSYLPALDEDELSS